MILIGSDITLLDFSALGPWLLLMHAVACLVYQLLTELSFEPLHATGSDGLDADREERSWAHRKITDQGVHTTDAPI